jgi:deoxyinosine 3'endonuclease (endonuclease V)
MIEWGSRLGACEPSRPNVACIGSSDGMFGVVCKWMYKEREKEHNNSTRQGAHQRTKTGATIIDRCSVKQVFHPRYNRTTAYKALSSTEGCMSVGISTPSACRTSQTTQSEAAQ